MKTRTSQIAAAQAVAIQAAAIRAVVTPVAATMAVVTQDAVIQVAAEQALNAVNVSCMCFIFIRRACYPPLLFYLLYLFLQMLHVIYIGVGGFIGAVSRFLISRYLGNLFPSFPLGTLTVNIIGSFILGFIVYSISLGKNFSPELRDFITIGILGGFTTMSSFAYESFRLFELNQMLFFMLNITLNLILCFAAIYAGKELAIFISK